MKYVMVTHWKNHWNQLPDNETYYTETMLRSGMTPAELLDNTPTVFIKLDESTRRPEQAWKGFVFSIRRRGGGRIYFQVAVRKQIPVPEKYARYTEGWHLAADEIAAQRPLDPPFFEILRKADDWRMFEDYTFLLLKLLGIHRLQKYEEQKGHPDGFLLIKNLAVIYDCTLDKDFEVSKEQQIKNYSAQLNSGRIEYHGMVTDVSHCHKQIWIITRGLLRTLKQIDSVLVKEVRVQNIIELYRARLLENFDEDELENRLRNID